MLENTSDLKVLGIAGSLREHSSSQLALEYAMSRLREAGCRTRVFDLRAAALPFCDGNPDEQSQAFPGVAALRQEVSEAHALVLVTPEYHGGISGVLKNALDLLDANQLAGKVAGGISVLGGMTNGNALNDLSRILRSCHAWVVPQQIAIGRASTVFADGQIHDLELRLRFDEFTASLVRSAIRLCSPDRFAIETHAPAA
jgi:FMN reductase